MRPTIVRCNHSRAFPSISRKRCGRHLHVNLFFAAERVLRHSSFSWRQWRTMASLPSRSVGINKLDGLLVPAAELCAIVRVSYLSPSFPLLLCFGLWQYLRQRLPKRGRLRKKNASTPGFNCLSYFRLKKIYNGCIIHTYMQSITQKDCCGKLHAKILGFRNPNETGRVTKPRRFIQGYIGSWKITRCCRVSNHTISRLLFSDEKWRGFRKHSSHVYYLSSYIISAATAQTHIIKYLCK